MEVGGRLQVGGRHLLQGSAPWGSCMEAVMPCSGKSSCGVGQHWTVLSKKLRAQPRPGDTLPHSGGTPDRPFAEQTHDQQSRPPPRIKELTVSSYSSRGSGNRTPACRSSIPYPTTEQTDPEIFRLEVQVGWGQSTCPIYRLWPSGKKRGTVSFQPRSPKRGSVAKTQPVSLFACAQLSLVT